MPIPRVKKQMMHPENSIFVTVSKILTLGEPVAKDLSSMLTKYSTCNHDVNTVCDTCREKLLRAGTFGEQHLSSVGRLATAIASAEFTGETVQLKQIAFATDSIIDSSIALREKFHQLFIQHQTDDVRMYNLNHEEGLVLDDDEDSN